jgi:hypothetical protein
MSHGCRGGLLTSDARGGERESDVKRVAAPLRAAVRVTFRVRARLPAKVARAALPLSAVGIRSRGGRRWGHCPDHRQSRTPSAFSSICRTPRQRRRRSQQWCSGGVVGEGNGKGSVLWLCGREELSSSVI